MACSGAAEQACGNCGTQTRTCDLRTGQWSAWSACSAEGACTPGITRTCENAGTQTCGTDCAWQTACVDQVIQCTGEAQAACGNCGSRTRVCDTTTGTWSDWSACGGQGVCAPDATEMCGVNNSGVRMCSAQCEWGACGSQVCPGASQEACGNCGARTRTCNPDTGAWSAWSLCTGAGVCAPGATEDCDSGGSRTCNGECSWDACACGSGQHECAGLCVDNNSVDHCGPTSCTACEAPEGGSATCDGRTCSAQCPRGQTECAGVCVNLTTDNANCGTCGNSCSALSARLQCSNGVCCVAGRTSCDGETCVNTLTDANHCGTCGNACAVGQACSGGTCLEPCPSGQTRCNGTCTDTLSDVNNCNGCGIVCNTAAGETCFRGQCGVLVY